MAPVATLGLAVTMFTPPAHPAELPPTVSATHESWQTWPQQDPNGAVPLCASMPDGSSVWSAVSSPRAYVVGRADDGDQHVVQGLVDVGHVLGVVRRAGRGRR